MSDRFERILLVVACVLGMAYAAQLWSPLRLDRDAIVLLSLASSTAHGSGMLFHGQPTHYPPGYPMMVVGLERLGIAGSATLVLLNLCCLAIGIACAHRILRRQLSLPSAVASAVCTCTLLSFVVIKHVTLPLSDLPYFGLSLLALACLDAPGEPRDVSRTAVRILAATVAAVLAIATRTIGIALLPAIGWTLWRDTATGDRVARFVARHRRASATVAAILVVGAALSAPRVLYIREAATMYRAEAGPPLIAQLGYRSSEMGEVLANVPEAKLPAPLHPMTIALGVLALALLAAGFWVRRRRLAAADVYLAGYCGILAVWPYRDARFWLPVVPLLFAYVVIALRALVPARPARFAFAACFAWALLTGAAGLAYSTALSLSGPRFADRYGDGTLSATYRYVLGDSVATADVNSDALAVLLEFGRPGTAVRTNSPDARPLRASR